MSMQVIRLLEDSGSSGHGWSYWSNWLKCQRAAWLSENAEPNSRVTPYPFQVGMIGHKLLEFHETRGRQDYVLEVPTLLTEAAAEAQKAFSTYRAYYKPGHWGKVLGTEVPLTSQVSIKGGAKFGNELFSFLPFPYTGRADLIIRVRTETHIRHWKEVGVPLLMKGDYIVDYKFVTPPFDRIGYQHSPQFTGYFEMRASLGRRAKNIRGTLVLAVNKQEHKRPPCEGLFIPAPNTETKLILTNHLALAKARRGNRLSNEPPECNVTQCGYGFNKCQYYMNECTLI